MKIAIIGAGFAGLSTAWHLLRESELSAVVDIFDPVPIGQGTSGLSSGLLHPYAGLHAKKSWESEISMNKTHDLISAASSAISAPVTLSHGILRPICEERQRKDFKKVAETYDDVEWWDQKRCEEQVPGLRFGDLKEGGGIYIKSGLTVDVRLYLEGLWQACAKGGAQLVKKEILSHEELKGYDRVVFCTGHRTTDYLKLPINTLKGQLLKLKWPKMPLLPFSIVGKGYLVMNKDGNSCFAGATFERTYSSPKPDPKLANELIMEKILPFFPALENAQILECRAGLRATTDKHLPFVDTIGENFWVFTALGSKGLLWHGFLGQRLAVALLRDDPAAVPPEVRISSHVASH